MKLLPNPLKISTLIQIELRFQGNYLQYSYMISLCTLWTVHIAAQSIFKLIFQIARFPFFRGDYIQ